MLNDEWFKTLICGEEGITRSHYPSLNPAHDPFLGRSEHNHYGMRNLPLSPNQLLRRGRDSNPRYCSTQHTRFPGVHLRPLGHLSFWTVFQRISVAQNTKKILKKILPHYFISPLIDLFKCILWALSDNLWPGKDINRINSVKFRFQITQLHWQK